MDEKEKTQEEQTQPEPEAEKEVEAETNPLDEAREINKKKEELLEREEKLQDRKEKLKATRMVGGKTEAGFVPAVKEETPAEYKDRVMRGEVGN